MKREVIYLPTALYKQVKDMGADMTNICEDEFMADNMMQVSRLMTLEEINNKYPDLLPSNNPGKR